MAGEASCIFCKIVRAEIASTVVHRDDRVLAIEDVNPQAPVHLLVLPLEHHGTLGELIASGKLEIANAVLETATKLGSERGGAAGFRLVVNTGADGGQTVGHVHVHVLAGRPMHWPP